MIGVFAWFRTKCADNRRSDKSEQKGKIASRYDGRRVKRSVVIHHSDFLILIFEQLVDAFPETEVCVDDLQWAARFSSANLQQICYLLCSLLTVEISGKVNVEFCDRGIYYGYLKTANGKSRQILGKRKSYTLKLLRL